MILLDFGSAFYGVLYSSLKGDFGNGTALPPMVFGTKRARSWEGKINDEPLYSHEDRMSMIRGAMGLPHLNDHQATLPQPSCV